MSHWASWNDQHFIWHNQTFSSCFVTRASSCFTLFKKFFFKEIHRWRILQKLKWNNLYNWCVPECGLLIPGVQDDQLCLILVLWVHLFSDYRTWSWTLPHCSKASGFQDLKTLSLFFCFKVNSVILATWSMWKDRQIARLFWEFSVLY